MPRSFAAIDGVQGVIARSTGYLAVVWGRKSEFRIGDGRSPCLGNAPESL